MEYTFGNLENKEGIRSDEVLNAIINNAIQEVVDTFSASISVRDKDMLLSVINEKLTPPTARVVYLTQLETALGVSDALPEYVRQVFVTLQQELTVAEQKLFTPLFSDKPVFESY